MLIEKILTPEEVAEILKITKNTVYELIKRGELTAYKVGNKVRVDMKDLNEYINRSKGTTTKAMQPPAPELNFQTQVQKSSVPPAASGPIVISGQDPSLDILANILQRHPLGTSVLRSYVGSFSGLISLYHNQCQMAAIHLWDGESNTYNVSYVQRLVPGVPCVIIRITKRTQGFFVLKDNPKKITNWMDLARSDVMMINREKGSGTRVLLDQHLRLLSIDPLSIQGYYNEESSHLSVISTISRGKADVGLGSQTVLNSFSGLDFVPLQTECYDLVIPRSNLNQPVYQLVYEILQSTSFKEELKGLGGYDTTQTGLLIDET